MLYCLLRLLQEESHGGGVLEEAACGGGGSAGYGDGVGFGGEGEGVGGADAVSAAGDLGKRQSEEDDGEKLCRDAWVTTWD